MLALRASFHLASSSYLVNAQVDAEGARRESHFFTSTTCVVVIVSVLQDVSGERNGYALHEQSVMVFTIDGAALVKRGYDAFAAGDMATLPGLVREMREYIAPASHIKDFWEA